MIGDYEPGNTEIRYYRARAVKDYSSGLTVTSDWSTPSSSSWDSRSWWLKHRILAGLNLAVNPASVPGHDRPSRDGEFQALSSDEVVIVSDTAGPPRGTIVFDVHSEEDRDAITAIFEARDPILIQALPGGHWRDRWVRLQNHSTTPIVDKTQIESTLEGFNWIEVPRPE